MQKLRRLLDQRKQDGTVRRLQTYEGQMDFLSNCYLFRENKVSITATCGSGGSRLLSGTSSESLSCERFLAKHFEVEAALVFASGYVANLSLFSTIPQRGDTVLFDEDIHASIRDGLRLSNAKALKFAHNDLVDLRAKLKMSNGEKFVVVESLYSMGGDMSPLGKILSLCLEFDARLIVDEAHAVGVFGEKGRGIVSCMPRKAEVFARTVTFGKAYGWHGAAILGSQELKDMLVNFARPFIYTTALPPADYKEIETRLQLDIDDRRVALQSNLKRFRREYEGVLHSESNSPIQVLRFETVEALRKAERKLKESGIAARAIYSPTVEQGKEILRLCFHADNTNEEIRILLKALS